MASKPNNTFIKYYNTKKDASVKYYRSNKPIVLTILALLTMFAVYSITHPGFFSDLIHGRAGLSSQDDDENKDLSKFEKPELCFNHYPWGSPKYKDKEISPRSLYICNDSFALQIDKMLKAPLWSSEVLLKHNFEHPKFSFNQKLKLDDRLPSRFQSNPNDYIGTNYIPAPLTSIQNISINFDHLSEEELLVMNEKAVSQGYNFSNTVPMVYENMYNTIWIELEDYVQTLLKKEGYLYVTTGSIYFNGKTNGVLGNNTDKKKQTLIPTHYFKIISQPNTYGTIAYIIPNKEIYTKNTKKIIDINNIYKCDNNVCSLNNFIVPIKEIESVIGAQIYPKLNPYFATQIKLDINEMFKKKE